MSAWLPVFENSSTLWWTWSSLKSNIGFIDNTILEFLQRLYIIRRTLLLDCWVRITWFWYGLSTAPSILSVRRWSELIWYLFDFHLLDSAHFHTSHKVGDADEHIFFWVEALNRVNASSEPFPENLRVFFTPFIWAFSFWVLNWYVRISV